MDSCKKPRFFGGCLAIMTGILMSYSILATQLLYADALSPADQVTADKLSKILLEKIPDIKIDAIQPSTVPGWFYVNIGKDILYISETGKYVFSGDVFDISVTPVLNLSEQHKKKLRLEKLDNLRALNPSDFIIYSPADKNKPVKTWLTVFMDIDCPHCKSFHATLPKLIDAGVEVRYLAFPRGGLQTETAQKMASIWCASDQKQAIELGFSENSNFDKKTQFLCTGEAVERGYNLGDFFGIKGTPTLIFADGGLLFGAPPTPELLQQLQIN